MMLLLFPFGHPSISEFNIHEVSTMYKALCYDLTSSGEKSMRFLFSRDFLRENILKQHIFNDFRFDKCQSKW